MKKLLLLSVILFLHCSIAGQYPSAQALFSTIDSIAVKYKKAYDIPGLAVAVFINYQMAFERAYGIASLKSQKPIDIHSDFHMASVSKPFTATAIMQMANSGKLNLDSSLCYYLPYFKMNDDRYREITLRHILTHSSGIPDVTDYEWDKPQTDDGAAERYARSFANQKLDFTPGSKFVYCNASFDILAAVIAQISGMSFEEYIRKNILQPSGMLESSFLLNDIPFGRRTAPHVKNSSGNEIVSSIYPYNRIHAPCATLHSNLQDMEKWVSLWLNRGRIHGRTILDSVSWKDMLTPRGELFAGYNICLSWIQGVIDGKNFYSHAGHDLGYRAFVGFIPKDGIAVVLMFNSELPDPGDLGIEIFKAIFAMSPK